MPGVSFPARSCPLSLWVPGGGEESVRRTWVCPAWSLTVDLVGSELGVPGVLQVAGHQSFRSALVETEA